MSERMVRVARPKAPPYIGNGKPPIDAEQWHGIFQDEKNYLGEIGYPWHAAFPLGQYVGDDGAHLMIYPRLEGRLVRSPTEIEVNEIIPAAEFILRGLSTRPSMIWSYNIGPQKAFDRKRHAQTWANWHIHGVDQEWSSLPFADEAQSKPIFEPAETALVRCTRAYFEEKAINFQHLNKGKLIEPDKQFELGLRPHGALVLEFENMEAELLANCMQELDQAYRQAHAAVFQPIIENYDAAADGQEDLFQVKEWERFYPELEEAEIPRRLKAFLKVAYTNLRNGLKLEKNGENDEELKGLQRQMIHRGPCYSVVIFRNRANICLAIQPHFQKEKSGGLELMGVIVDRQIAEEVDYSVRKQNAIDMALQLGVELVANLQ